MRLQGVESFALYINLFDSHVHSDNSPEGRDLVTALCSAAVDKGISGICITEIVCPRFRPQEFGLDVPVVD